MGVDIADSGIGVALRFQLGRLVPPPRPIRFDLRDFAFELSLAIAALLWRLGLRGWSVRGRMGEGGAHRIEDG